ncbi:transposase [Gemmatimonadota bacterium]
MPGEQGGTVELKALEFIARLILHIPDVRERQVLYYGAYNVGGGTPARASYGFSVLQ